MSAESNWDWNTTTDADIAIYVAERFEANVGSDGNRTWREERDLYDGRGFKWQPTSEHHLNLRIVDAVYNETLGAPANYRQRITSAAVLKDMVWLVRELAYIE